MRLWLLRLTVLMAWPTVVGRADPLVGDVGAAYNSPEAAEFNPANAGFLRQSEFFYAPEIYKEETVSVRYPTYDASVQDTSGVTTPLTKPSIVFKVTPRLGIGGFYIPALPIKIQIHKTNVPVILLTQNLPVDINAVGQLNGLGVGMIGYRFSDSFGLGLGVTYQSFSFDADLTPSIGGTKLASVKGSQSELDVILGTRIEILPDQFNIGLAVTALSHQATSMQVDSPLINSNSAGSSAGAASNGSTAYNASKPFTGGLIGMNLVLYSRVQLLLDLRYTRADPNQTAFSLPDLTQKKLDVHDTLAVRSGAVVKIVPGIRALFGARYEPASIGPGGRGPDSLAGYGSIQLIQVLAGLAPQTPYYMFAGGLQLDLFPKPWGKKGRYYQLLLEGGLAYTYSSLGIDASGELPGAYLDRRLSVPVALGFRF